MINIYNPQANESMIILCNNARFQILANRMIRMEWADDGMFEDRPTLSVVNRKMPSVDFKYRIKNGKLIIKTSQLTLEYVNDGKPFSENNLKIMFELNGADVTWYPGLSDEHNLKGTARTLDGVAGWATKLNDGFISRSGWALHDDSNTPVIDRLPSGKEWVAARPDGIRQDWYFFGYGHDYKSALRDAALIFGHQPIPPRWALGYWWSRYWAYTDKELEELINEFSMMGIPLDVLVIDMDWHLEGWTGYTWDRRYFPDPEDFIKKMKSVGLKVTLNLHPAQGVGKHEEMFEEIAKSLGMNPKLIDRVPFDCTDPKYMESYFKILHHPLEKMGVDFWWIDWQQGTETKIKELDPLPWLNYLHWRDIEKRHKSKRPIILSRYGGAGSGRYPIGFSGDTISTWESLSFQPYFTATASNALFGYWSHDIGGHMPGEIDPELYLRWIQFGIFSPIFRTHTTKNPKAERRVWKYPDPYSKLMIDAIKLRYKMIPYIYTEMRKCYDTGISLCRPMYYDYPDEEDAYEAKSQYMFGDEMLVAPIVKPVNPDNEMAIVDVWLPAGTADILSALCIKTEKMRTECPRSRQESKDSWFDTAIGNFIKAGIIHKRQYMLSEIPVFVRPGTIIPEQRLTMRLRKGSYRNLGITIFPGDFGSYILYEDDGVSNDYQHNQFATIQIEHETKSNVKVIRIGRTKGTFDGFLHQRSLEIRLPGTVPPKKVIVNNTLIEWDYRLKADGWTYNGFTASTIIRISKVDIVKGVKIEIKHNANIQENQVLGLKGLMTRLERIAYYSTLATSWKITHPEERLPIELAQTGNRISRNPQNFVDEMKHLQEGMKHLPEVLHEFMETVENEEKKRYLQKAINIALVLKY